MKPKVEYQIVCAGWGTVGHKQHGYTKGDYQKAVTACGKTNADLVDGRVQCHDACFPFVVLGRVVGPWEPPGDADELAVMLGKDWWA